MIVAPTNTNLIPVPNVYLRYFDLLFLWLLLSSLYITPVTSMSQNPHLARKRSLTEALGSANQTYMLEQRVQQASKKLRRLPHVFSRVLELPMKSDADVSVENNSSCFRFAVGVGESASLCGEGRRVGARVVQVYPGVVKVVATGHGSDDDDDDELPTEGLELDRWRFRLPVTTKPERAMAVCVDGELVVTVPKDSSEVDGYEVEMEVWSGIERFVEVL